MQPDFHPDIDFVHPNTFGHAAIAAAMLQGLGETAAAQTLRAKYYPSPTTQPTRYPALSYTLEPVATPLADGNVRYIVHYGWTPAPPAVTVRLQAPAGWTATPAKLTMATGAFTLTGTPDRLTQNATLSATAGAVVKELPIALPAPWLVGAGMLSNEAWPSGKFTADKAVLPFEAALANGDGLGAPQTHANGTQLTWTRYQAGVDYTGGNDPGSLDFAQVTLGKTFEVAYAARWVYSPDARPVRLNFGTNIFAGTFAVTAYLNGATLYTGTLTTEPNRRAVVDGKLNKGWNLLLLKSNHFQWQWQLTCALSGDAPDDLADLRYSTATKMPTLP